MTCTRLVLVTKQGVLNEELVSLALAQLGQGEEGHWLSQDEAWQAPCPDLAGKTQDELKPHNARLRDVLSELPIEAAFMAFVPDGYKILASDMDKTMIDHECIDEMAFVFGVGGEIAAITEQAMQGKVNFAEALRQRVALLKGFPIASITDLLEKHIALMPGARAFIKALGEQGIVTLLVSGGFTHFANPIAHKLGFDYVYANELEVDRDWLTGAVKQPIVDAQIKSSQLIAKAAAISARPDQTIAIGDGANDIAMIRSAGLGIAYRAKQALIEQADIVLRYADLSSVRFFLGFDSKTL